MKFYIQSLKLIEELIILNSRIQELLYNLSDTIEAFLVLYIADQSPTS